VKALAAPPLLQRVDAHAHGEACLTASYRPWGVSNTKAICPLVLGARRPRLRRGLLQQRRIALRVSRNAKHRGGSKPPPRGHSLHGISFPWVSGSDLTSGSLVYRRSRLPPQSFLPVGIGEATSLVSRFNFFDFVSLHSLSCLWVSGRQCR